MRSGDRVISTAVIAGYCVSLLHPFLQAGIRYIELHSIVTFSADYLQVLEGALMVMIPLAIAKGHMILIRRQDAVSPPRVSGSSEEH